MMIGRPSDISPSEITPQSVYLSRRELMAGMAASGVAALLPLPSQAAPLQAIKSPLSTDEPLTSRKDVTSYNNFYEFGVDKDDPAANAHTLKTTPWKVKVDGLVGKPGEYDVEDIVKSAPLEERIYRMRCVEGWSMVIPWYGFPMAELIRKLEPLPRARFVRMETLVDPEQMPGQRRTLFGSVLDWPYVEGLRMDEARNPLTFMALGVYGKPGPNQNGAPIRLVVPWKYGFKGVKSIVRIMFEERQPRNTWQVQAPNEYGFYANVNPNVNHPRWSQARELRIGELFRRPTLMFNGYGEQVASMYEDLDLRRNY